MTTERQFKCFECGHGWSVPYGTGRPGVCPECGSTNIHRAASDRGFTRNRQVVLTGGAGRGPSSMGRGRGGIGRGPRWA